ncbi:NADPH-dependent FMN reductase [Paracoccus albus]|uniref:NADPH-dependent FMN reductase n=1 Tax=Paracoccus albus TaxID=3017784 RepID=UPI0022F0054C|nr:NAD(P)H-dependent oxidoreductase [Paracoccus albus]WBU60293.1 NAD(P)H-dependent oxidoreductase [Paracoccus albus]
MRSIRTYLNIFTPKPGKLDELETLQKSDSKLLGPISANYGWRSNTIYRADKAGKLVIVTHFSADQTPGEWHETKEFKRHLARLDPVLDAVESRELTRVAQSRAPEQPVKLGIVTGSTRDGRFGDRASEWILKTAQAHEGFDVSPIDLRDHDLPFFGSPTTTDAQRKAATAFAKLIEVFDAYILTVAEYNHAPTAVLKNALDHLDAMRKPVAYVAYGGVGGARAVEHLRAITAELRMVSVRDAVHINYADLKPVMSGNADLADIPHLARNADTMLDELAWWARLLRDADHPG